MIWPPIDHLRSLNQGPVSFIKFKELSSLLSAANVNLTIHRALQYCTKVSKWVFHLFKVDRLACKVFEIMHYNLFSIWYKYCNPIVFWILLQTSLCLLNFDLDLLETAQVNFIENFVLDLFKVFFLESDLIRDGLHLFIKAINLLFVDWNMLNLVSGKPCLVVDLRQLLCCHATLKAGCLGLSSILYCLLNSLLEVCYLIVDKVLIDFHFFLEIAHLPFVDELEYPRACLFNGLHTLLLQIEHLETNLRLEVPIRLIVNVLSLQMQNPSFTLDVLETFKVAHHKWGNVIKSMVLMERSETINAYPLLIIKTEEIELFSMQTTIYRYRLRTSARTRYRCNLSSQGRRHATTTRSRTSP